MRKTLIGLLLASIAAGPALADDDDRGRGKGKKHRIEREWRGGDDDDRRGGWKRERWNRGDDFRPVRIARVERDWDDDDDDDDRERWQDRRKQQRDYYRALQRERRDFIREARRELRDERRFVPVERVIRVPVQRTDERQVLAPVRYAEPVVRYVQPRVAVVPTYADYGYDYAPRFGPVSHGASSSGLFGGGGGGVLGALLPIVLQSALGGGDLGGLGGLGGGFGGLTSLSGLGGTGLGGLGGLAGLASPSVIPLDTLGFGADSGFGGFAGPLASGYVPAAAGGDLSSLLLPALLSQGGSLF